MRNLASDNNAGIDPQIFEALAAANQGHAVGYGDDPWTARLEQAFQAEFGPQAQAYPVLIGTAANVLSLAPLLKPYEAVLCARSSHLYVDECGAPERFLGCKLIPLPDHWGKIQLADLPAALSLRDVHRVQPRVLSITQPTEMGALYSLEEMAALADFAHRHEMLLHVDGARIANAAVALEVSFAQLLVETGVDVVSFGGTKNGLMCGEAVVFLKPDLAPDFGFYRKQAMQLSSKMRFLAVQLEAYLTQKIWQRNAQQANQMASYLAAQVQELGLEIVAPVETNAVFVKLPAELIAPLQAHSYFYIWDEAQSVVRWMTAFDHTPADIDSFVEQLKTALEAHP